jgi:lysophospholipase L1-like esterase
LTVADEGCGEGDIKVFSLKEITFGGCATKTVMPGEFFSTDPISLSFDAGEYLCLEITFSGKMIPYHDETLLPVFVKGDAGWKYSKLMPFASMIGCKRAVKGRIAYLGDSITQGIGTAPNSYLHWNARFAEKIGNEYSHWNLGLGYGRANDAASDGAWLYKARQNDIVFVCFGVNDILQGLPEEQIKSDLTYIVKRLKECGRTVILQTVPPFDYNAENTLKWQRINGYIKTELSTVADIVFDNVATLGESEHPEVTKFGAHPDEIGCEVWANALYDRLGYLFS